MCQVISVKIFCFQLPYDAAGRCPELDAAVTSVLDAIHDLSKQLSQTTLQQASELGAVTKQGQELVAALRSLALQPDPDCLHHCTNNFHDCIDHILEASFNLFVKIINIFIPCLIFIYIFRFANYLDMWLCQKLCKFVQDLQKLI